MDGSVCVSATERYTWGSHRAVGQLRSFRPSARIILSHFVWMIETAGSVNGSNESMKFGFKIDLKILMDRISKFRPDHDVALVDIVYHCCFRGVRWRARYIAMKRSRSRFKID